MNKRERQMEMMLQQVEGAEPIILVRALDFKDNTTGIIVVNKSSPEGSGNTVSIFYFDNKDAIAEVSPREYRRLLNNKMNFPDKDIKLGDVLYEGTLNFIDFNEMIKSVKNSLYAVKQDDDPLRLEIGYKCRSGRKWKIKLKDFKTSISKMPEAKRNVFFAFFKSSEGKKQFLQSLNQKPFYSKAK
jgi:hypothetical protein